MKAKQGIQKQEPVQMVPETALALKVHCNLSDDQYQMIKNASKAQFADIYPSLHKIFDIKQKCYPEDLQITETSAQCSLQNMVNHTLSRILVVSEDNLQSLTDPAQVLHGTLFLKAGFDGASSQSI